MRKTWTLVVVFIATAAAGAEWSYVPEGRASLEVPDAIWERALTEAGIAPVVARTEISYLKPLRLFDEPEARMWCAEMGRATMTLEAEITVGGETHTRALQRVMMVNWKTERAARVPEELRKAFAALLYKPPGGPCIVEEGSNRPRYDATNPAISEEAFDNLETEE
jgi:acyl-CoA thioesterase FadM